jgi:hypothetical protein
MRDAMKLAVAREIKSIAEEAGADGWVLVRESKHLIIDFRFGPRLFRQVLAATPSGARARRNEVAWLKRHAVTQQ